MKSLYPFTYEAELEKNKGYYWKKTPSYFDWAIFEIKFELESEDGN